MLCPRDGSTLLETPDVLGPGLAAHVCPKCTGVLVSDWSAAQSFFKSLGHTLDDLHALVNRSSPSTRKVAPVACTSCGKGSMKALIVERVELDLCEECGATWFDRDELSRLTRGKLGKNLEERATPGERSDVVGVYEMWWDCEFCGATALLGKSNPFCPNCGAQQNAERRYFPPEGKESAYNGTFDGVDKRCPACSTPNGAKANNCRSCGSPLDGSERVSRVADRSSAAPTPGQGAPGKPGRKVWPWVLGAIAVLSCGLCGLSMLWTKPVAITVASHQWSREIDVERMQAMHDDSWCDSMPSGAYSVSRSREQRSTRSIADGQECSTRDVDRGNGTFERRRECHTKYREEPVYDMRCSYTIDRWGKDRTQTARGTGTQPEPSWPPVDLRRSGCNSLGCEREGPRRETYTLSLTGADHKSYSCDVPVAQWQRVGDGTSKTIPIGVITGSPECDKL